MWKFVVIITVAAFAVACEGEVKNKIAPQDTDTPTETNVDSDTGLFVDADDDGLPDSWEIKYFGSLDENGAGDFDGDGISNEAEYHATSDPTSADTDIDTGPAKDCADTPWEVDVQPINILVLLDRSRSMHNSTIGTKTYAETVQAAIDDIVEQNTRAGIINFALNVFPDATSCTPEFGGLPTFDGDTDSTNDQNSVDPGFAKRCAGASGYTGTGAAGAPTVAFSQNVTMDTYTAISSALETAGTCGGTPICNTLKWARKWLAANAPEGKTFVLLATDGAPSCNVNLDEQVCKSSLADDESDTDTDPQPVTDAVQCLDHVCTYNESLMLAVEGRPLYLIGVGEDLSTFANVMNVIAYYGTGGTQPEATMPDPVGRDYWYYPASSAADLSAALEDITNNSMSCVFDVDWAGVPDFDSEADVAVDKACDKVNIYGILSEALDTDTADTENKVKVAFAADCADEGDSFGWNWNDLPGASWGEVKAIGDNVELCTQVRLCPKACDALKIHGGEKAWTTATAKFGCNAIVID